VAGTRLRGLGHDKQDGGSEQHDAAAGLDLGVAGASKGRSGGGGDESSWTMGYLAFRLGRGDSYILIISSIFQH
jgi:hypothetical protein